MSDDLEQVRAWWYEAAQEVGRLTAECRRLDAERDAAAAEAAALRAALSDLLDEQNGPPLLRREHQWQEAIGAAQAALAAPPTAWAAVAAARARVCEATRALDPFWPPDSERSVAAEMERRAALIALRAAEAAAGVKRDA